jgi:hypothetical protein
MPTKLSLIVKRVVSRLSTLSCQPHGPSNPLPDLDAVLRRLPSSPSATPRHAACVTQHTLTADSPECPPPPKRARIAPPAPVQIAMADPGLHAALLRPPRNPRSVMPPVYPGAPRQQPLRGLRHRSSPIPLLRRAAPPMPVTPATHDCTLEAAAEGLGNSFFGIRVSR